ncbi:MAG TPA: 50S ribosomal protein L31 [Candidatus Azoamicus sp.]
MNKKNVNLKSVNIFCSCGNAFELNLVLDLDKFNIEVCNKCHPFYTGKQKIVDVAGRVDNFNKKFSRLKK